MYANYFSIKLGKKRNPETYFISLMGLHVNPCKNTLTRLLKAYLLFGFSYFEKILKWKENISKGYFWNVCSTTKYQSKQKFLNTKVVINFPSCSIPQPPSWFVCHIFCLLHTASILGLITDLKREDLGFLDLGPPRNNVLAFKIKAICGTKTNNDQADTFLSSQ